MMQRFICTIGLFFLLSFSLSSCKKQNCGDVKTLDSDVKLVITITDSSGNPIGASLNGEAIRLKSGLSLPQFLKKEWTNIAVDQSEFTVDLTPSCGLPTSQNYTLEIGSLKNVIGTISFDKHTEEEACANICTGKFISRINFDGVESEDFTYNDGIVRRLEIQL